MHGEAVGIGSYGLGVTPSVALAYAIMAAFLYALSRQPEMATAMPEPAPAKPIGHAVPAE
jgi:AGZA family xanthine/uracil permease-like MFS transporter